MLKLIADLWKALLDFALGLLGAGAKSPTIGARRTVTIAKFDRITPDPPPMHWSPCHPSTIQRFKASMTCPRGHSLTLKSHSILVDGRVQPSVICPHRGCDFHEFIRLEGWDYSVPLQGRY